MKKDKNLASFGQFIHTATLRCLFVQLRAGVVLLLNHAAILVVICIVSLFFS